MVGQAGTSAEEVVRALAAASAAVRLYPPTSEIPAQTVNRFVRMADAVTSAAKGPVRFVIEPKRFKLGETVVAEGQAQVSGLAETLYAHQAGQLIVAPGLSVEEANSFLRCIGSDPSAVREEGGLRNVIIAAGVTHIAIIEVTLRASTEEGLAGLDLTSAPLDAIGPAVLRAAAGWARSAATGEGRDELGEVIQGLESAARELAAERVAQALLQLDEQTRGAVLAAAIRTDSAGRNMDGMLSVIAGMKPATLARLLALAASRTGADPHSLMAKLTLPPEAMRALELLLRPSPRTESESGVPPTIDAAALAGDATLESEEDESSITEAKRTLVRTSSAPRALLTTVRIVEHSQRPESLDALAEALPDAICAGAFGAARAALEVVDRLSERPDMDTSIARVRHALAQPDALAQGLSAVTNTAQALDAASVLSAAGPAGGDALVSAWLRAGEPTRAVLDHVARATPEQMLTAAGRRIRSGDPGEVRDLTVMLGRLGDRRAVSPLSLALDHDSPDVRSAAITALASLDNDEAWAAVVSALTHPDQSTARAALAAIRKADRRRAVPALLAVLQLHARGTRNQELKREIIEDVRRMKAVEAIPVLERIASRKFAFGRKVRELRDLARQAVSDLQAVQIADGEKVRT
jgi:HEAT repeat protein